MDQIQGKEKVRAPPPTSLHQAAAQNRGEPSVDPNAQPAFFGSFFKKTPGKPGMMEQVPTVLKASGVLSEREQVETEVISISPPNQRVAADFIFQHLQKNSCRFDSESYHAQPCN